MKTASQRGSTLMGLIIGLVVGLGVALAVALYVSKVPLPFKGGRPVDAPSPDASKDKDWNPNSVLQPKPAASTPSAPASEAPAASPAPAAPSTAPTPAAPSSAALPAPAVNADPLGTGKSGLSTAPSAAPAEPFQYFVQVGAFRTPTEADAQKARMALLGMDAKVSERDQSGRPVYRVRLGPFDDRDLAERIRTRLADNKVDSALVRVQR